MQKLVLVEDDARLAKLVQSFLQQHGYRVKVLSTGENAVERILSDDPDLVILDIMLPETDGFSICRRLRPSYDKPILFLTAKDSPIDHVMGLEMGADDYIIKPIDPHVLLARIHAIGRRANAGLMEKPEQQALSFDLLTIDKPSRSVTLAGESVDLTSHEFELLWLLASHAGEPLSRNHIHQTMIGREYDGLDRTVDVRISRLRKKLKDNTASPSRIVTVWGKGYMLSPTAWQSPEAS